MTDKPQPGSQAWLHQFGHTPTVVVGASIVSVRDAPAHCAHPDVKRRTLAHGVVWCFGCGSYRADFDEEHGGGWIRPQARSAKEIEAMREELRAVHSDLGDASQSVFDLFESLKEKEAEITRQIAEHRSVVGKLTDTIENLKRDLEIAKNAL